MQAFFFVYDFSLGLRNLSLMPIVSVFRVRIDPGQRQEFKEKFATVSVSAATNRQEFISEKILKPTK
jgi:hypothetical protein